MKKLAVAQIVLGALVVGSILLFVVYVIPGYYYEVIIDSSGSVIGRINGLHKQNVFLDIWSFAYPVVGLAVFGCGVAQYLQPGAKQQIRLTIVTVVLGVLIMALLAVFIIWGEPHFEPYTRFIEGGTREVIVQKDPDWTILQVSWKAASFVLGILVLGCGIAQHRRAKRIESKA